MVASVSRPFPESVEKSVYTFSHRGVSSKSKGKRLMSMLRKIHVAVAAIVIVGVLVIGTLPTIITSASARR